MKAILNNWSIMRGLRLVLGIFALVQALTQKDMTLGLLAGFLLLTAISNIGCCGSTGCGVNYKQNRKQKEFMYEELDAKE